jgi:hypothetical protein
MDNIIVYVDNADHALQQLVPMKSSQRLDRSSQQATQWILVACTPRVTKHISKWVSRSARENWRAQWSGKLFSQIAPTLKAQGDEVHTVIAHGSLPELTEQLLAQHRGARVMDARCPRFGQDLPPVTRDQPIQHDSRWSVPSAVAGMSALLVLASD